MTFDVVHMWRDEQGRTYSERVPCETEAQARATANNIGSKGDDTWIEERRGKARSQYIDRPSEPFAVTPEKIAELKQQIRALASKMKLPEEDA